MFQVFARPTVLAASCLLASCVIIPIGGGEPHPFGKERLDFVEIGVTQKDDVRSELGRPRIRHGGKWWMYRGSRKESDWLVIAGGGYMADAEKLAFRYAIRGQISLQGALGQIPFEYEGQISLGQPRPRGQFI